MVYNPVGDCMCLFNCLALYDYLTKHDGKILQGQEIFVPPSKVKSMLINAMIKAQQYQSQNISIYKELVQEEIQKISQQTSNIDYIVLTLFPYLEEIPIRVKIYTMDIRGPTGFQKNFDQSDNSDYVNSLETIHIFLVIEGAGRTAGHYRLLFEPKNRS